jgi:hypothetical protein
VTDLEEVDLKKTDKILVTVSDRAGQTFEPDMEESDAPKKKNNYCIVFYWSNVSMLNIYIYDEWRIK